MTRRTPPTLAAALLLGAALLPLLPRGAAAQAPTPAHQRVQGCYRLELADEAPWLREVDRSFRLTLDPVPPVDADPGGAPQFLVREAADARVQPQRWTYLAWSLFGDGDIVSVVWSSGRDQVALTFVPEPGRPNVASIGSTTFFQHEKQLLSDPVDVTVAPIAC